MIKIIQHLFGIMLAAALVTCVRTPSNFSEQVSLHVGTSGNGRVVVSKKDSLVDVGSTITLIAVPDSGSIFLGWFGTVKSTKDSLQIIVSGNIDIEARFQPSPTLVAMVKIPSKNTVFAMGSSGATASGQEKPLHQVLFTYTYFIDKYEVTQEKYQQLMGTNPSQVRLTGSSGGIGTQCPVFSLSWYEAALFCNARSRAEGLDTVYSFTAICADNQQCPYVLENLTIHYERFGYRLPTEAEWEYACRGTTTTDFYWGKNFPDTTGANNQAWYVDNASDSVHPVGQKQPNAFGLFDMSGNVAEWVDDWLGVYRDSTIADPIGPSGRPQIMYEDSLLRPVRGGAYNLGAAFLRSSCRKGPYDTPAKLFDKSIGFRCVLGVFFPSSGSAGSASTTDTSGVTVCNQSALISLFGTSAARCVFVKNIGGRRTLWFIDFSEPATPVHRLADSLQAYNPVISPNGKYVAYSSKGENNFSGPSTGTIMSLSASPAAIRRSNPSAPMYIPRWWVDPTTQDTFVVYSNNTDDNNLPQWKSGKTFRQKVVGGSFSGNPEILCDSGSFYGGLSFDGNFLATGFKTAHLLNLRANDLYTYFAPIKNGTNSAIQVCNVSITPGYDRQDEIMFLDFGSSVSSTIVGKPYGLHSIIFTSNSADSIGWYEKPADFDRWEDVEWSNHPRFAAAVAKTNADEEQSVIYGIDLQTHAYTHAYTPIAQGKNLWDPYIWIDPRQVPQKPDPYHNFAKYDVPGQVSGGQIPLCMKLKLFWKRKDALQCAIVGGSPAYFGVDPAAIRSVTALNMATLATDPMTSVMLSMNYVIPHIAGLKIIIMALDAYGMAFNISNPYLNGLPRTLGYQFDAGNNFWKGGIPQGVVDKIAGLDSSQWPGYYTTGYTKSTQSEGWGIALIDGVDYDFNSSIIQDNIKVFNWLAETLSARNTHLLVVNFPENPLYKQTAMIGRKGPSRATYEKLAAWLKNLEGQNAYFHFYDANNGGDHDYSSAEALDCNHLNYLGARKLSGRLDSLIRVYMQ